MDNVKLTLSTFGDVFKKEILFVLNGIIKIAVWFRNLTPGIKKIISTIALIAAAIGPVLLALGGFIVTIALIKIAIAAIAGLFVPVVIILGVVSVAIALIYMKLNELRKSWGKTWKDMGSYK